MGEVVSLKEFAVGLGVRPSYVTKLKQAGRLVLTDDGVDVEASLALIEQTADPNRHDVRERWKAYRANPPAPAEDTEPEEDEDELDAPPARDPRAVTYQAERLRKMKADADLAEMERDRQAGRLVDTAAVRAAGAEAGTVIRTVLENLPDQLAPMLAPITDEDRLRTALAEHIETVLTELASRLQTIAERIHQPPTETPPQ